MAMTSILLPRSGDLSHPPACSMGRPWWEELGEASLRQPSPRGAHPAGHGAGQRGSRPISEARLQPRRGLDQRLQPACRIPDPLKTCAGTTLVLSPFAWG